VPENTLITMLRENREAKQSELDELLKTPTDEKRDLNEDEDAKFAEIRDALDAFDKRITELVELEERQRQADEARKTAGVAGAQVNEPNPVYRKDDSASPSFFRDLATASKPSNIGFDEARQRLAAAQETRAGDMTTVAGAGGEFAPPLWLVEDFVALARPGRVAADLCNGNTLPSGVSSVNLPKVASGVTVAVQQTQNTAVSDTAMTTTSVSSGITTLAGQQVVSLQLIDQSGIPFDRVVLQDLAKAYAGSLDTQVLYGSNANGQLNGLVNVGTAQAFTTTQPAVASTTNANSLYYAVTKAIATVWTNLYQPATALIMHPRRWAWILGSVDSNSRPLVIPDGSAFNSAGQGDNMTAQGRAGTFAGLPVYVDPNISTAANSTTNQDEIYVVRQDELYLWETPVQSASFDATYANQLSILFRVHGYAAFIPNRYTTGASVPIRGTGLIAP
jgi:HK97 family phage major capsid protein